MPPPPARPSRLDLLDAYIEALWRGEAPPFPFPEEPARGDGDDAEALAGWALDRLRELPRAPQDEYVRGIGDLLEEFRGRRHPWNAAALRLLGDVCVFVGCGPRRHEDWAHDVLAVMHRAVADPRGRLRLDPFGAVAAQGPPAYPFAPPAVSEFPGHLHPLEAGAAVAAVAVMAEEWQAEPVPVRERPDRDALMADARTLLGRFGPAARHWTNATAAAGDPAPDLLAAGLSGTRSHGFVSSTYIGGVDLYEDLGVIVVNDDEVGVFWSFGAY